MPKSALCAALLLAAGAAVALPAERRYGRVEFDTRQDLFVLSNAGYMIDHPTANAAEIWMTDAEFEALRARGYRVSFVPDPAKAMVAELAARGGNPYGLYWSAAEIGAKFAEWEAAYPAICQRIQIGTSVQGRPLWMLKISDNVAVNEAEPEFKYVSTMHGDEPVGTPLLMNMIEEMLAGYAGVPRMTAIVDNTEVWIMPLMNPDGFELGQRANANGEDLNRSFPDIETDPVDTTAGREPETAAMMNFSRGRNFALSANFHTGTVVVNYPLDSPLSGQSSVAPDDDVFRSYSLTYSRPNTRMFTSGEFEQGITNGAEWYIARGGMQDWNYHWMGNREVTIELNDVKWPSDTQLAALWTQNRESMFQYLERVNKGGIRGRVLDKWTGQPLAAKITVAGRDTYASRKIVWHTDPQVGDYYLLLLSGVYSIKVEVDGQTPRIINGISVSSTTPTIRNIEFEITPPPAGGDVWSME